MQMRCGTYMTQTFTQGKNCHVPHTFLTIRDIEGEGGNDYQKFSSTVNTEVFQVLHIDLSLIVKNICLPRKWDVLLVSGHATEQSTTRKRLQIEQWGWECLTNSKGWLICRCSRKVGRLRIQEFSRKKKKNKKSEDIINVLSKTITDLKLWTTQFYTTVFVGEIQNKQIIYWTH